MDVIASLEKEIADLRMLLQEKESKLSEIRKEVALVSIVFLNIIHFH